MSLIVFWLAAAIIAAFLFEFGRRIDIQKYPDVAIGMVLLLLGGFELVKAVGVSQSAPSMPVLLVLSGVAVMAGHYLWSECVAWLRTSGYIAPQKFIERRKPRDVVPEDGQGDLTRTVRLLKKEAA